MVTRNETQKKSLDELEESIAHAMSKVNVQKIADLCHFIPGPKGRLHHLAFGKLKKSRPNELLKMIKEHVLEKEKPTQIPPNSRADLKVKRTVDLKLKRSLINQLVDVLKSTGTSIEGAEELISVLAPYQTLKQVQKLMLDMVRSKEVDTALWNTYVKLIEEERAAVHKA
jgi:hypothetical protein